jgi:DNA-binding CsgD family transcriptional regulator
VKRAGRQPDPAAALWPELSASEVAVVQLVIQGATDREVAQRLYISAHTVNSHLRHVFAKLGIRSRVELAHWASQRQAAELPLPLPEHASLSTRHRAIHHSSGAPGLGRGFIT